MIAKIFYVCFFLIVLVAVLAFGGENAELVTLDLIFVSLPQMPLFVLALGALAVGILLGLIPALVLIPWQRIKMSALKNRIQMLEQQKLDPVKS